MELTELPTRFISALRALDIPASEGEPVQWGTFQSGVQAWNAALKLKGDARFVDADTNLNRVPVPPVPFTVIGWPVRMVVWGLNPHYSDAVLAEKRQAVAAPGTWGSYARFHLPRPHDAGSPWPGVLPWAIKSQYYYNLGTVAATLQSRQFHTLQHFYERTHQRSERRLRAFWDRTQQFGVMAAEFLPFHSKRAAFPINVRNFLGPGHPQLALADQMDAYHEVLLQTIVDTLGPDGWIIALGNAAANAAETLLKCHGTLKINYHQNKIQVGVWTPQNSPNCYKVSLSPFMGTAGGPLNRNADIERWLQKVW